MILLRIKGVKGACRLEGGAEIERKFKYHDPDAGWFPIESANFGFRSQTESKAGSDSSGNGKNQNRGNSQPNAKQGGGKPIKGGTGSGGAAGAGDEAFTTISIGKFVDIATTTLMKFAMEDRTTTKAEEKKMRVADIHFLESVRAKSDQVERYVFPYMMIHLQNVLVKGWNITGQGDDRPSENLELWYDKAALKYYRTTDGKTWMGGEVSGWDQSENKSWDPSGKDAQFFLEQPHL